MRLQRRRRRFELLLIDNFIELVSQIGHSWHERGFHRHSAAATTAACDTRGRRQQPAPGTQTLCRAAPESLPDLAREPPAPPPRLTRTDLEQCQSQTSRTTWQGEASRQRAKATGARRCTLATHGSLIVTSPGADW